MVELEMLAIVYIIGKSLVKYQIGYVPDRYHCRRFQTYIAAMEIEFKFKEFKIFLLKKRNFSLCRDSI